MIHSIAHSIVRHRWPIAAVFAACTIGALWSVTSSAPPAPDARPPAADAPARATAPMRSRPALASDSAAADAPEAAAGADGVAGAGADPDDLDHALALDPWERLSPAERIARARDLLEQSLGALTSQAGAPQDRAAHRLQAASALTALRAELGATEAGRREVLAYAARLHAMAAR